MSGISEREVVMRERAAFRRGYRTWRFTPSHDRGIGSIETGPQEDARLTQELSREYPLPQVQLGEFAGREYRLRDGVLEYKTRSHTPVCGPETNTSPRWDRASLQPEDLRYLADALDKLEAEEPDQRS